jgi:NAD(P)H-nitrite reductase large subunit
MVLFFLEREMDDENSKDRLVCFCHAVSYQELVACIEKGANTLSQIQAETLASTGCGGCECDILELLEKHSPKSIRLAAEHEI